MTFDQNFSFDNNVLPPKTGTGNTLLVDADIVNQKILQFYRALLQTNLGARWAQECMACGLVNSNLQSMLDGYIVGDAICYPAPSTLKQTDYKFPLLSVYRQSEEYGQMSTHHIVTKSRFITNWILPPLNDPNKLNHLYPFLSLVSKTLLYYTFQGSDPKVNNQELFWKEAGFAFATIEGAKFGSFLGQDGKTIFPSIEMTLEVYERNQAVLSDLETFDGVDGYVSLVDGYNINNPVSDFEDFIADVALSVSSFSPSSGPVSGNTLVYIYGNGFEEIQLSQQSQITIAGNAVLAWEVKQDNVILAITGYSKTATSGPIVITDQFGNTATSSAHFTYI